MSIKSTLTATVCLCVLSFAALPEMRITTKNNAEPQSKNGGSCQGAWTAATGTHIFDYITVTEFKLTGSSADLTKAPAQDDSIYIRLRGNSTADAAKKPYRIKFDKKVSLIDRNKEPAKSWALLANFYDGTFALNAMAFEMGKRMGLDFTNSSQLVDLYINNQYKGIYQLTEQIQSNKRSVDLRDKHNGWLVEFDYHAPASDECLRAFIVDQKDNQKNPNGYNITSFIKAPELDDTPNPKDSTQLRFVKNDLNNLLSKMRESSFPNNGYRDLIDLDSWAKYVLIQLVLDNFDFNSKTQTGGLPGSNFLYRIDDCSKIQAGPLWDFDLAAGVRNDGGGFGGWGGGGGAAGFPSHYQTYQDPIAPTSQNYSHVFYKKLWEDPVFKAKYKKLWDRHKSDFQNLSTLIDNIKSQVSGSITGKGTNTWANNSMMGSGALTQQQFDTEVSNLKTWLTNRIGYVDQELRNMNIDTSKDIAESTPSCNVSGGSSSSGGTNNSSSSGANSGLTCSNLQANVEKGATITEPTLTCSNGSQPSNINWTGRPQQNSTWTVSEATTTTEYNISVTATCGAAQGLQANCGTVTVGSETPIRLPQIAKDNKILAIKNGVSLHVQQTARVDIYNLNGKLQKSLNFENGVYNVPFEGLPKGMYVAKVSFGSSVKILRVPVM
ncbi:MAG: CotH kinase family protein [Fibromonadaceae bacterium]|jgi:hypothetical protein|nr:CotH kinase family protein [Fibromonadaceae bacterium]